MNLKEAKDTFEKYSYLEETEHNGQFISMLVIAPKNLDAMPAILDYASRNKDYYPVLSKYSDFDVFVIFDLGDGDYFSNALSSPVPLSEILKQLDEEG